MTLREAVVAELYKAESDDSPDYWVRVMNEHGSSNTTADWPYWQGRIATGDGVGKAPHAVDPPGEAQPEVDPILASIEAFRADFDSFKLESRNAFNQIALFVKKAFPDVK